MPICLDCVSSDALSDRYVNADAVACSVCGEVSACVPDGVILALLDEVLGLPPTPLAEGRSTTLEVVLGRVGLFGDQRGAILSYLGSLDARYTRDSTLDGRDGCLLRPLQTVSTRYWWRLKERLVKRNRFFANRVDSYGFDALEKIWREQPILIPEGELVLYRARRADSGDHRVEPEMGPPPPEKARAGRANPEGIAYLYLASTSEVAIAELKPHVGESLWVARFTQSRPLKILDLRSRSGDPFRYAGHLQRYVDFNATLEEIGRDLSSPIRPGHELEYLPTQYICELAKLCKFDGVAHYSSVSSDPRGYNVILFDPSLATWQKGSARRYDVKTVNFHAEPVP